MMQEPQKENTFSIIVPSWNRANVLSRTINSLLDQTYPYWELIIIDDASTDETPEILKEYQKKDSRIKVITHEKPTERWNAYLEGFKAAQNEWITGQASDDEYTYVALEQFNHAIKNNPDYKAFYCGYVMTTLEDSWPRPIPELEEDIEGWGMKHYDKGNMQGLCSFVFHKDCRDALEGLPKINNCYDLADWFGLQVEKYWKERGLVGEPPIKYNQNDSFCGNPWGDDHVISWFITRKYKAKRLTIRPTIAYDRTQDWLYERANIVRSI